MVKSLYFGAEEPRAPLFKRRARPVGTQMSTTVEQAKPKAYKWLRLKCCRCGAVKSCEHMADLWNCEICDRCEHGQRWTRCELCGPTVTREGGCCEADLQASDFYFQGGVGPPTH